MEVMMKRFGMKTVFAAILGIPLAFAQTAPESSKDAPAKAPDNSSNAANAELPAVPTATASGSGRTVYGEVEYLLWWMKGMELPALATTSPNGTAQDQAGVLGAPGTTNLFGGNSVNTSPRSGGRFVAGAWLDNEQNMGLEAEFLFLEMVVQAVRFLQGHTQTQTIMSPLPFVWLSPGMFQEIWLCRRPPRVWWAVA
jgi:hypothetical protein